MREAIAKFNGLFRTTSKSFHWQAEMFDISVPFELDKHYTRRNTRLVFVHLYEIDLFLHCDKKWVSKHNNQINGWI